MQSDYFKALCKKEAFKVTIDNSPATRLDKNLHANEATSQEGQESIIHLDNDDEEVAFLSPDITRFLIQYLYTLDYNIPTKDVSEGSDLHLNDNDRSFTTHAKVFAAAEYYGIPELKDLAILYIRQFLETYSTPLPQDIAEAIKIAYGAVPDHVHDLRELVLDTLVNASTSYLEKPEIEEAVASVPKLGFQLFKRLHSKSPKPTLQGVNSRNRKLNSFNWP